MMFNLQMSSTNMKLLPLACLCLLTRSGTTLADEQKPVIIKVKEDSDVILPCSLSSKENIEYKVFDWKKDGQKDVFFYDAGIHYNNGRSGQDEQFKDRVSHFQDELKYGNASIIIRNTKVTDSGNYTCEFPRRQIFHIQLVVGASPKPYVTTIDETKDWELLQCEVRGAFPKPTVEWQDSAGNKLPAKEPQVSERGGSFYIILQTTVMKTDRYRCVATQEEIKHQIRAEIYVYISGSGDVRVVVKEGSDAILPCSLSNKENMENKVFDWKKDGQKEIFFYDAGTHYNNGRIGQDHQFKGRVSHFQDELKYGNTSIIIRNTKVTDSGDYTCIFPHLQPRQIFHIQLVVDLTFRDRLGEISAGAKPSVTTLDQTADRALLECEVLGAFPKPTVEWQDSAGNKLPAEEPQVSDIILQTTVTKTDRYRCVATQEEIKHQTEAKTYVYISGHPKEPSTEYCIGWTVAFGIVGTLLLAAVLPVAVLRANGVISLIYKRRT